MNLPRQTSFKKTALTACLIGILLLVLSLFFKLSLTASEQRLLEALASVNGLLAQQQQQIVSLNAKNKALEDQLGEGVLSLTEQNEAIVKQLAADGQATRRQISQQSRALSRLQAEQSSFLASFVPAVLPPLPERAYKPNFEETMSIEGLLEQGILQLQQKQFTTAKQYFTRALQLDDTNQLAAAYQILASFEENPLSGETPQLLNLALATRSGTQGEASTVATLALATIYRHQGRAAEARPLYNELLASGYYFNPEEREAIVRYLNTPSLLRAAETTDEELLKESSDAP